MLHSGKDRRCNSSTVATGERSNVVVIEFVEFAIETRLNGIVPWSWSSKWKFYNNYKKNEVSVHN